MKENVENNYLTKTAANGTYLTQSKAESTYATKTELANIPRTDSYSKEESDNKYQQKMTSFANLGGGRTALCFDTNYSMFKFNKPILGYLTESRAANMYLKKDAVFDTSNQSIKLPNGAKIGVE